MIFALGYCKKNKGGLLFLNCSLFWGVFHYIKSKNMLNMDKYEAFVLTKHSLQNTKMKYSVQIQYSEKRPITGNDVAFYKCLNLLNEDKSKNFLRKQTLFLTAFWQKNSNFIACRSKALLVDLTFTFTKKNSIFDLVVTVTVEICYKGGK